MFTTPAQFHDVTLEKSRRRAREFGKIDRAPMAAIDRPGQPQRAPKRRFNWSMVTRHFGRQIVTSGKA